MKGKIIVLVGLVLILAGLLWHAALIQESTHAANEVQKLVPQLQKLISEQSLKEKKPEEPTLAPQVMKETIVDGTPYVGVLEIPILRLELPVISFWSGENGKIAPCRYSGSVYLDDMILCAHNYNSHFGELNQLNVGDPVQFTDIDGNVFSYLMQEAMTLESTDVEKIRDGDWDLILFTCTPGGKMRYVVTCIKTS